nr:hypothetical protein [Nocardia abscessus]
MPSQTWSAVQGISRRTAGNTECGVGRPWLTWHNRPHARFRSTTCGTSPRRLQARLQRLLSARFPPVAQRARSPDPRRSRLHRPADTVGVSQPLAPSAGCTTHPAGATP